MTTHPNRTTRRRLRAETFTGAMHLVVQWHLLLVEVEELSERTGRGLAGLWGEIHAGDFPAARAHLDRLLSEDLDEVPDAPTVKVTPDGRGWYLAEVRCPFCEGTHIHSPGPWGPNGDERVADCGFRGYHITDPNGLFTAATR